MSNPESLVNSLAQKMGIDAPVFENGLCAIQFDKHVLNFQADAELDELRCFLRVADVPAGTEARMALYRLLLKANALGRRTGGGQLGIDDQEAFVVFTRVFSVANMAIEQLESIVEALLNLTEEIQRELAENPEPESTSSSIPAGMRA